METITFSANSITTETELRELIGSPHDLVANKSISFLDDHCKRYIAMSPLLFLATSNASGQCDVSPRGDGKEAICILNDHQLVIPDRPGNKRLDSILNIISNPHVGLIFLIPGLNEVLRINGRATIIKHPDILRKMEWKNKAPLVGIGVDIQECFIHCPRALKEAAIWQSESWPTKDEKPAIIDLFRAHLKINGKELKD